GITGDTQVKGFEGWIACESCSWNIEREFKETTKAGSQDLNLGVAELPPIELEKNMDLASTYLMYQAINGKPLGTGEIVFLENLGDDIQRFLEYTLDNVVVRSWSISGSEDERPTETFSLWYRKIKMKYTQIKEDGKVGSTPEKGWNTVTNTSW
ncbi:MAG: type VI secretion system tube protein Hcp, partial [Gammaproteobacteria bacterium]|nr:type VI secretion system tube protein Hcp [Gammaproteobacteria bacterium]